MGFNNCTVYNHIGSGDQVIIVAHSAAVVVPSKLICKGDGSNETFADNGLSDAEEEQIRASNNLGDKLGGGDDYVKGLDVLCNEDNNLDAETKCQTVPDSDVISLQKTWPGYLRISESDFNCLNIKKYISLCSVV